jgi:hypothetical protein
MLRKILLGIFVLAVIFFIDNLLLIAIGCTANLCGASSGFYCTFFCKSVKGIMALSIIIPAFLFIRGWIKSAKINAQ